MKKNLFFKEFNHFKSLFNDTSHNINAENIFKILKILKKIQQQKKRLFIAGLGGGAANSSHATNDFRKLCKINAICLTDNISELTARINDDRDNFYLKEILEVHNPKEGECLMLFSVGGGSKENNSSLSLYELAKFARKKKLIIISLIGRKKGLISDYSNVIINLSLDKNKLITPITETFQPFIWHYLVSSHMLKVNKTKW
jgi:D-sedoheptulose 7-phosphate isomerase